MQKLVSNRVNPLSGNKEKRTTSEGVPSVVQSPIAKIFAARFGRRPLFAAFCVVLFLGNAPVALLARNTSFEDAAKQLADRVAGIPNLHGPLRLEFFDDPVTRATATKSEPEWKTRFREALAYRRLTIIEGTSAPALRVAVTETPTQVIFTASAHVGDRDEIRIVAVNRANLPATNVPVASARLERQLLFASSDPVLDASSLWNGDERGLAVLQLRNGVLTALHLDASGAVTQTVSLASANVHVARDLRAELVPKGRLAEIHLFADVCEFAWIGAGDVRCRAAKPVWRDTTVLTSPCDSTDWKLEADGNDWTSSDILQAIPGDSDRHDSAVVMSEFPGPVLSINGEQNPSNALVAIRNLRTGNYEVYKITLACGD